MFSKKVFSKRLLFLALFVQPCPYSGLSLFFPTTTNQFRNIARSQHDVQKASSHNNMSLFMNTDSFVLQSKNDEENHHSIDDTSSIRNIRLDQASDSTPSNTDQNIKKLQGKLKKQLRQTCLKFQMIEDGDHIMCCVSGGKDSATMLYLLCALQKQLQSAGIHFQITAVHLNQMQPGYNGEPLVRWLEELEANKILDGYKIITEDTYTVVMDKTPENKVYCSMCSRLRRGILYSVAHDINANKIALGHHGDDAIQTLLLNFIHAGQMKGMPARYYSTERNIHVIRPLMGCLEEDIRCYAKGMNFPILPCNLCGTQPDAQRAKVRMLLDAVEVLSPNAKKNMINAMGDVRPSHLLDIGLREACGMDGSTGMIMDPERASLVKGYETLMDKEDMDGEREDEFMSQSKIEKLL